jgi:DNA-binding HxlR family transcriptional regulator
MAKPQVDLYSSSCPSRNILELIGGKWSMLLVCSLRRGPVRTGELKRHIDGISQKMLTQTLRDLERHGIIERIDYAEVPPRVEYKLTRLGQSLGSLVLRIEEWVTEHYSRMVSEARECDRASATAERR